MRFALLCNAATIAITWGSAVRAETHSFDVPAEEAGKSIPEFARQAGTQIVAPGEVLRGMTTQAVKGVLETHAALKVLLQGTGLSIVSDDGHIIALAALPKNQQAAREERAANLSQQAEEIMVTAQKREQSIRDVPMAVTAIRGGELGDRGIVDVQQLSYAIPELTVFRVGGAASTIMLRGLGISGGTEPVVGVYLDDIAVDGTSSRPLEIRPLDLERVEVLYGPQGTLYGQGSEGGTVKYITKNPVFGKISFDGTIDNAFTEGGAPTQRFTGIGNLPIVDSTAALRIVGTYENDGGWVNAPSANQKNINGNQIYDVRIKGLWNISDKI
jgi:outer membrane receptor protein involved in Fe transport